MLSIGQNGFFEGEPLIVVTEKGKNVVVEGNRRLAAVKLLNEPGLTSHRVKSVLAAVGQATKANIPKELPCLVFKDRKHTLEYLGFRHITGAKPWGPLAKAQFLAQLRKELGDNLTFDQQCSRLAKTIGSNSSTVRYLLISLALYHLAESKQFYGIEDLDRETFEFGVFYTAVKAKEVFDYIGRPEDDSNIARKIKPERLEDLIRWIFEKTDDVKTGKRATRLGESRNIVRLCRVLRSEEATKAFKEGVSLEAASEMAGEALEAFEKECRTALENLKLSGTRLGGLRQKLTKVHEDLTSEIQYDANELFDRVRKIVRKQRSKEGDDKE